MTEADIAELFVQAAETEKKLPQVKGMRESVGGYVLPWVHDLGDINSRRRTYASDEKLLPMDDPLVTRTNEWLDEWAKRATKAQVSGWEACLKISGEFLTDAGQRRALWAWALSQANHLIITRRGMEPARISFARWCRDVEKIAEITGHRRKTRAIDTIAQGLCGKAQMHDDFLRDGVLPCEPENGHVFATVEGRVAVYDTKRVYSWRDDPSFNQPTGMTLSEWRAAKRRQQERRKRAA